jgi:hypothetical protein
MQVRRFSADLKSKVHGGHLGHYAVPIHVDRVHVADPQALAARLNGLPILVNRPLEVAALYLDACRRTEEHRSGVVRA